MEMKYVVPDMAQSFGTLEFAGESDHVFDRDKDNRRFFARRSYNLYSDVQRGENVVVEIPVQAGEKHFKYEQKVKLVNPKLYGRGYAIGDMGHTDYVLQYHRSEEHTSVKSKINAYAPLTIRVLAGISRTARIRNYNQSIYQI